jgi:hypothetical protein
MILKYGVEADSKYSVRTCLRSFYETFSCNENYTLSDGGKISDNM